jgi:hypothetical protein
MPDFDYFAGELACPVCGAVTPVAIQTGIQYEPQGAYLRVGDRLVMGESGAAEADYLTLRMPDPHEEVRLLHFWQCDNCAAENWAEVTLDGDRLAGIAAAPLDRAALDRTHFISDTLRFVYDRITGQPLYVPSDIDEDNRFLRLRRDWLELLRGGLR